MIDEIEVSISRGQYDDALKKIEEIRNDLQNIEDEFRYRILESKCLIGLGEFESALQKSKQLHDECEKRGNVEYSVNALLLMIDSNWRLGRFDEVIDVIEQTTGRLESMQVMTSYIPLKALLLHYHGWIMYDMGDLSNALKYLLQSQVLNDGNDKLLSAQIYNALGAVHDRRGSFDVALLNYNLSLDLSTELNNKHLVANVLSNIGVIQHERGYLDNALENYFQSLAVYEELGNKQNVSISLFNIGVILHEKADYKSALAYLERSYSMFEVIGNKLMMAVSLYGLISVSAALNDSEGAEKNLVKLESIKDSDSRKFVDQIYRVAKAVRLKMSTRTRSRGQAEAILEEVLSEEIADQQLAIDALLNLCELLILDLRASGNEEVLNELQDNIERLSKIARNQDSYWLLSEVHVLQAKLALLKNEMTNARFLFTQAQMIADERGLRRLAMRISSEHDLLLEEVSKWGTSNKNEESLSNRLELIRIDEQIDRMFHPGVIEPPELPEEHPIAFLILNQGGLIIYSEVFTNSTDVDEYKIGAFLSAIQSFSSEYFSQTIDRIRLEEYTLLIKYENQFTICYIYKGQSYSALQKIAHFISRLRCQTELWQASDTSSIMIHSFDSKTKEMIQSVVLDVFLDQ
ncbi:MAG: tetratricopeptide repeat protein [Candidatus Thorarchaeota archaeon]